MPLLRLLLLSTIAFIRPCEAQTESAELVKLREGYEQARQRALDPIEKKYAAELEKLKARYTKEGKLEDALGVEVELKRFLHQPTQGFKGQLVPEILTKGEWKFYNKPENYTTWLSFTATGDVFERGQQGSIGRWEIKGGVLRTEFKGTWNEFATQWEGEKPVLKEKDSNSGKRRSVTLEQL